MAAARPSVGQPVRVMMLGLRGFPGVQGGVESHAQHLCAGLAALGCDVTAIVRSRYMTREQCEPWQGVRYVRIWSPRSKAFEALGHTFLGLVYAIWHRPDIVHIHAIGPAIWTPLGRMAGLKVVVTHHGPHYQWQKWGVLARLLLRIGEQVGMRFSNARVAIASSVQELIYRKYGLPAALIRNGVEVPALPRTDAALQKFGLTAGRYFLLVGRLAAEKRHADLIDAFRRSGLEGWKLAIVGGADHPDEYSDSIARAAASTPDVIMTGALSGEPLREIFAHAGCFVLTSSHEGLSIALLEALSYGLPVILSDIPGNREVAMPEEDYYPCGDVGALMQRLQAAAARSWSVAQREERRSWVRDGFSWDSRATATLELYGRVLAGDAP